MKKHASLLVLCFVALMISVPSAYACRTVNVMSGMDYQKVFAGKDTKYVIKQDINLSGKSIRIGEGSTLVFKGGSLANGVVIGNNTRISADDYEIFKHGYRTFRGYTLNGIYKYATKTEGAIIIEGTWQNRKCGIKWTGMDAFSEKECAGLSINNFIQLHRRGTTVVFPKTERYYVYEPIICNGYSLDFNGSTINSIDFNFVENNTIQIPKDASSHSLKSLYGLVVFEGNNASLKNLIIDGRASKRIEDPSLGTECLLSMSTNTSCVLDDITLLDAVGCGICTYAISDCSFRNITIKDCGEHGIYTHAYKGVLQFDGCSFINCGQNSTLFKKRGQSACIKFSGSRDRDYSELKDLRAYFSHCLFSSDNNGIPVATTYSDLPYAEFSYCKWEGNVSGYSVVSPDLATEIGRLIEYRFVNCVNPCAKIKSANTIRRLLHCTDVHNPFADAVELDDCEIVVEYADVDNNYTGRFVSEYNNPVVCKNCSFIKKDGDFSIRNTIKSPRPMTFIRCKWNFPPSEISKNKGSYYLVLSDKGKQDMSTVSVSFHSCDFAIDRYRMLYCNDTDVDFKDCNYISSYGSLVDAQADQPNRVRISSMKNQKNLPIARHYVARSK